MAIVIDIKNAIRSAIYSKDDEINFFFNEIKKVEYPYVFFYIPSFRLPTKLDDEHWQKVNLMCVVEYAKSENNTTTQLWTYADKLSDAYSLFEFKNEKISARNVEFKLVEGVLQMTFDLEFYVKLETPEELAQLMQELNITITPYKEKKNGSNTTNI
jgi:hypothetical protein